MLGTTDLTALKINSSICKSVTTVPAVTVKPNTYERTRLLQQGLNMSSADVAWSSIDENLIATGATNGAVVAWDLTTAGRNKQLAIFNEHSRSVSKVSFHPTEGSMLLSGSQVRPSF